MADPGAGEKLKVFISYSRKDSAEFADELVAGLEYGGFAPFLDRHDIAAGEDWEARLGGLIAQSDTLAETALKGPKVATPKPRRRPRLIRTDAHPQSLAACSHVDLGHAVGITGETHFVYARFSE